MEKHFDLWKKNNRDCTDEYKWTQVSQTNRAGILNKSCQGVSKEAGALAVDGMIESLGGKWMWMLSYSGLRSVHPIPSSLWVYQAETQGQDQQVHQQDSHCTGLCVLHGPVHCCQLPGIKCPLRASHRRHDVLLLGDDILHFPGIYHLLIACTFKALLDFDGF